METSIDMLPLLVLVLMTVGNCLSLRPNGIAVRPQSLTRTLFSSSAPSRLTAKAVLSALRYPMSESAIRRTNVRK